MNFADRGGKKNPNEDIQNLFNKIGGDSGSYKEFKQESLLGNIQRAWPLVNAIEHVRDESPKRRVSNREANVSSVFDPEQENPLSAEDKISEGQVAVKSLNIKTTDSNLSRSPLFASRVAEFSEPSPALFELPSVPWSMPVPEQPASSARFDVQHKVVETPSLQGVLTRLANPKETHQQTSLGYPPPAMQSTSMSTLSPIKDDSLAAVFSRLAATPDAKIERQSAGGLRNMLGFLRK